MRHSRSWYIDTVRHSQSGRRHIRVNEGIAAEGRRRRADFPCVFRFDSQYPSEHNDCERYVYGAR